jgi:uracil-DNA glycosylase
VTKRASSASAPQLFPQAESIEQLRARAKRCKACDLWRNATQTVFGEGTEYPKILFVGEQPGNQEDLQRRPFVGPAGKLLDSALEEAEIDREKTYITNAVKHFKWELRGKRGIHKKPSGSEIAAPTGFRSLHETGVAQALAPRPSRMGDGGLRSCS